MKTPRSWNRRHFLQLAATTAALQVSGTRFATATVLKAASARFAYIGAHDALHVYKVTPCGWVKQQTLATRRPVAIAIANCHLYVANEVANHGNLPRGSAEAYQIDPSTGRLKAKNQVPLSLSAIMPRDLAVAPDRRSLLVAAHGGGVYNVLPIKEDGSLGKVSGILKSCGAGPHPRQTAAHPEAVIFDSTGRAIAADQGSDRLHTLTLRNGALSFAGRYAVAPGSGPSALVLHRNGRRLFVANSLMGTLSSFNYDASGSLALLQTVKVVTREDAASLALNPACHMLYSATGNSLHTWRLAHDGTISAQLETTALKTSKISLTANGDTLFALAGDAVVRMNIKPGSGVPGGLVQVASVAQPLSIALLS